MSNVRKEVETWLANGQLAPALDRLNAALESRPFDASLLELKARVLMADLQYDAALQLWRDVIAARDDDARGHLEKARCLAELGAMSEALEALETALALDHMLRGEAETDWRFDSLTF